MSMKSILSCEAINLIGITIVTMIIPELKYRPQVYKNLTRNIYQ